MTMQRGNSYLYIFMLMDGTVRKPLQPVLPPRFINSATAYRAVFSEVFFIGDEHVRPNHVEWLRDQSDSSPLQQAPRFKLPRR